MADTAIELKNVGLSFGDEVLLKSVSVSVKSGECFVLIGPSGQGKSCLMKIMAGLIVPTSGDVEINSHSLLTTRGKAREVLCREMGMLFQKNALFDSLTVAENVAFPMREVVPKPENEIQETVHRLLDAVGILHAKDLFPDEISGGMQKRLGIARALALKPKIIFYDDPTAGLDPITSRKIVQLILTLKKENGATVVAITNDMNRAYQMADHIGMVVDQELVQTGTVEDTLKHKDPRVVQFIHGQLEGPLSVHV